MVGAKGVLAALALSPAFISAGALAQNGYGFSDAANSAVRYGAAPATPVMTCASPPLATAETTVVSARVVVPAADGVREHCPPRLRPASSSSCWEPPLLHAFMAASPARRPSSARGRWCGPMR